MSRLTRLFEPISLGSVELPNRIVFPATTTFYDMKGEECWACFYAARGKSGAGLLVIGALQVIYLGKRQNNRAAMNSDKYLPQLQRRVKAIHHNRGKAAAQLAVWNCR